MLNALVSSAPAIDISVLTWGVQILSYQQCYFLLHFIISKCYRQYFISEKYETF